MGIFSGWQLLTILVVVVLIFGTKKLRNVGSDLGRAIRDFRKGIRDDDEDDAADAADPEPEPQLRADQDSGATRREAAAAERHKHDG